MAPRKPEELIKLIEIQQRRLLTGQGQINAPTEVSQAIVTIRLLLLQMVDLVSDADLDFKRTRAARFDKHLKDGVKRSPAEQMVKMDQELIAMENNVERVNKYMKYCDSLVSAVQSMLKVQASGDRGQY